MPTPTASVTSAQPQEPTTHGLARFAPLAPLIVGLASARAGLAASVYSYSFAGTALQLELISYAAVAFLGVFLLAVVLKGTAFPKHLVNIMAKTCMAAQLVSVAALGLLAVFAPDNEVAFATMSVLNATASPCALCYWLRRARGGSSVTAAVFVFSALALSEVELFVNSLLGGPLSSVFVLMLVALQFPALRWARKAQKPYTMADEGRSDSLAFMKESINSRRVLVSCALGVAAVGLTVGMLRVFPDGTLVALGEGRAFSTALTIALCLVVAGLAAAGRRTVLTSGIWTLILSLSCCALTAYAAWSDQPMVGAVLTASLNALMVGYCCHLSISFMSYGWRDPYFYAIVGWLAFHVPQALGRTLLLVLFPLDPNAGLVLAATGDAILFSALLVFGPFLSAAQRSEFEQSARQNSALDKLMGIDEAGSAAAAAAAQQNAVAQGVATLGTQFSLSAREVEVLSLYALGHTQKHIATKLFITPGTVHEHIRHIYTKTGFHSRQDILNHLTADPRNDTSHSEFRYRTAK